MQRESEKQPAGKGPLAEIDFWRERNAVLSALYEQLNLPHVKRLIAVVELGSDDRNLLAGFKSQVHARRLAFCLLLAVRAAEL